MESKKISVIITTYNRRKYLEKAINGILEQTYKNFEIIIIDDNSSDDTYEYILENYEQYNIKIFKNQKNQGPGINRKTALEKYATGELILFLDDDDRIIDKNYFKKVISLYKKYDDISVVAGAHQIYDVTTNKIQKIKFTYDEIVDNVEFFINFGNEKFKKPIVSVAVFNRKALESADYKAMKILNDTTIFLRALPYGNMAFINSIEAEYLIHGNNISFSCTVDFIIDNLNEKLSLYKIVKNNEKFKNKDLNKWLLEQVDITIMYFIKGSKPKIGELLKLLFWCIFKFKNTGLVVKYLKIYLKTKNNSKSI